MTDLESSADTPQATPDFRAMPKVLGKRYRIERLLGAGGMGTVYRALDLLHEQFADPQPYVALKVLSEAYEHSPDASALLFSEFALIRHLRHPNVLRVYSFEVDTQHQRVFVVMELLRGPTLDRLLCERPLGMAWYELRDIALPLLDALGHAHERGVLHGDIKPSNVLLSEDGIRLFDFGLGQAEEGTLDGLAHVSRRRVNAWTPGYAAPEILEGAPLTRVADLYALGCLLYELASGKHPFNRMQATDARDMRPKIRLKRPKRLSRYAWPYVRKALSFDPEQRSVSIAQLREALAVKPGFWG